MSSMKLESLIPIGFILTSQGYYTTATQALYYYDYFLTLSDEVKYAWAGEKTWIFLIFILNRYLPIFYQIWVFFVRFLPQFTQRTYAYLSRRVPLVSYPRYRCDKTAFLEILSYFMCTILAQISLTIRLYALTHKSKRIISFFCAISLAQFLLGMYMVGVAARKPAERMLDIPLEAYKMCVYSRSRRFELVYVSLSMFFDVMTFFVIVCIGAGTGLSLRGDGRPNILRTIVHDATIYFLGIFIAHFMSLIGLSLQDPSARFIAPLGTFEVVFIPLMISRLMLSLKKASRVKVAGWTTDALSRAQGGSITQMSFRRPSINPQESDGTTTIASEEVALSDIGDSNRINWRRDDEGTV